MEHPNKHLIEAVMYSSLVALIVIGVWLVQKGIQSGFVFGVVDSSSQSALAVVGGGGTTGTTPTPVCPGGVCGIPVATSTVTCGAVTSSGGGCPITPTPSPTPPSGTTIGYMYGNADAKPCGNFTDPIAFNVGTTYFPTDRGACNLSSIVVNASGYTVKVLSTAPSVVLQNPGTYNMTTYGVNDQGSGVQVTNNNPIPTVSLTASPNPIPYNTASTLSWTSTNADSCQFSGVTYRVSPSGSQSTGNLISNTTYSMTCTGLGGTSAPTSIEVDVILNYPDIKNHVPVNFYFPINEKIANVIINNYGSGIGSCSAPGLPAGLTVSASSTISPATCVISGTPTTQTPNSDLATVIITGTTPDGCCSDNATYGIAVGQKPKLSGDFKSGAVGASYYSPLVNTGGPATSCQKYGGNVLLPPNLPLIVSNGTCALSGTPIGTYTGLLASITATNNFGYSEDDFPSIVITDAPPDLTTIVGSFVSQSATLSTYEGQVENDGGYIEHCSLSPVGWNLSGTDLDSHPIYSTNAKGVCSFAIYNLNKKFSYNFSLTASNPSGNSSIPINIPGPYSADPDTESPPVATIIPTANSSQFQLSIPVPVSVYPIAKYDIYRSNAPTALGILISSITSSQISSTSSTLFTGSSLTLGKKYCYTIKETNTMNVATTSIPVCFIPPVPKFTTPKISGVYFIQSSIGTEVDWTASTIANGTIPTGYDVYKTGATKPLATVANPTLLATFSGLTLNTKYCYQVQAYQLVNKTIYRSTRSTSSCVTLPATLPTATRQSLPIVITPTPIFSPVVDQTVIAGQSLTFDITAEEQGSTSTLTYIASNLPTGANFVLVGDVNGDGKANTTADSLGIGQYLAGTRILTPLQMIAADVDGDGQVTSNDSLLINQAFVKLIPPLQVKYLFAWAPTSTQVGSYTPQFSVSDGTSSTTMAVNVTVTSQTAMNTNSNNTPQTASVWDAILGFFRSL